MIINERKGFEKKKLKNLILKSYDENYSWKLQKKKNDYPLIF